MYIIIYIHVSVNISTQNHMYLYEPVHEFMLKSTILIDYHMGHASLFLCVSIDSQSNSKEPIYHHLPSIYIIVQFSTLV